MKGWLLLAIVTASALSMSFTMHLPQGSAVLIDSLKGMAQHSGTCHDQSKPTVPAAAKFQACCVVCYSNAPAASLWERTIAFADQPFAADTPPRHAGRDIHPDPHPPRS